MKNIAYYKIVLAFVASMVFTSYASAQQNGIVEQRRILDEALSTIEDYESYSTISDDDVRYSFLDLFVDGNAPVFNDILGAADANQLPVSQYSKLLGSNLRNKKTVIKNIKKESISRENGVWKIKFSFEKTLSYANNCGVLFSSAEFYGKPYQMEASLVYDEQQRRCKIESIKGSVDSQKKLSQPYFAFKSEDKRDSLLRYNGEYLSFNSYNQALLLGEMNPKLFSYADPDMWITPSVEECNKVPSVSMKYRPRKWRMKVHYDFGLGEALKLDGKDIFKSSKTKENAFGLDFGYIFPSKSSFKTGLFMGVGMTQTEIDMAMENSYFVINTNADVDGDNYARHYKNLALSQNIKLSELNVPIYLDCEYRFNPIFAVHFDVGLRLNLNMKHEVDATEGSAYVYGIYPQYNNLRLDEHWGYNGFGNQTYSTNNLAYKELIDVAGFSADAMGTIGLRFSIPQTPLSLELSGSYLMGLTDMISTKDTSKRFIEIDASDLNNVERITNMTELLKGVKRQTMRFNVGVILKM